jgi:hypothetical protein
VGSSSSQAPLERIDSPPMSIDERFGNQPTAVPAKARALRRIFGEANTRGERFGERWHRGSELPCHRSKCALEGGRGRFEIVLQEIEHCGVAAREGVGMGDNLQAKGEPLVV